MQGIKWRLSFQSSKPTKQLKKLWLDYSQLFENDKGWNITKFKTLALFLEGIDNNREESLNVILEELNPCRHEILINFIDNTEVLLQSKDKACDDPLGYLEAVKRMLIVIELLLTTNSSSSVNLNAKLTVPLELYMKVVENCFKLLTQTDDNSLISTLLRLIKKCLVSLNIVYNIIEIDGLSLLVKIGQNSSESQMLSLITQILIVLIGNYRFNEILNTEDKLPKSLDINEPMIRGRANSGSSIASSISKNNSVSMGMIRNQSSDLRKQSLINNTSGNSQIKLENPVGISTDESPNPNSLWNVLNEIIKLTPLSSNWLNTLDPNNQNDDDLNKHDGNATHGDEDLLWSNHYILSVEDILSEEFRVSEWITQQELINFEDSTHDLLLLNPNNPRNALSILNLFDFLLLLYKKASTPQDVKDVLNLTIICLIHNPSAQSEFVHLNGISTLTSMILNVEQNLSLIAPVSKSSRAAATGSSFNPSLSPNSSSSNRKGHFYSFAGDEFDEYYYQLLSIILKLLLDEPSVSNISSILLPDFNEDIAYRVFSIKNFHFLKIIPDLVQSNSPSLVIIGIRLAFALIKVNPLHAVSLESFDITNSLINCLISIIYTGKLHEQYIPKLAPSTANTLPIYNDQITPFTQNNSYSALSSGSSIYRVDYLNIFEEINVIIQFLSLSYQKKDHSLLHLYMFLILSTWMPIYSLESSSPYELERCKNCDLENAVLECICESCIQDQCSRLCEECDKVFHKSAIKRTHIRVPIITNELLCIPCTNLNEFTTELLSQSKPITLPLDSLQMKVIHWNPLLEGIRSTHKKHVHTIVKIHQYTNYLARPTSFEIINWKEIMTCAMTHSFKCLQEDLKSRDLLLSPILLEYVFILYRSILVQFSSHLLKPLSDQEFSERGNRMHLERMANPTYKTSLSSASNMPSDMGLGIFSTNDSNNSPLEALQFKPKRVIYQLIFQIITLYFVGFPLNSEDFISSNSDLSDSIQVDHHFFSLPTKTTLQTYMKLLVHYNIDALLVHSSQVEKAYLPLINSDRQFIWWLMRELSIVSLHIEKSYVFKLLSWFEWILGQDEKSLFQLETVKNKRPITYRTIIPKGYPLVSKQLRMIVLQELRCLLSNEFLSCNSLDQLIINNQLLAMVPLPIINSNNNRQTNEPITKERLSELLFNPTFSEETSHKAPMKPNKKMASISSPVFAQSAAQIQIKRISATVLPRNHLFKECCVESGLGLILFENVFGTMAPACVHSLMSKIMNDHSPKDSYGKSNLSFNDLDREYWWTSLGALTDLLSNNTRFKQELEESFGSKIIIQLFLKLMDLFHTIAANEIVELGLAQLLLEFSLEEGHIFSPSKPFYVASSVFPKGESQTTIDTKRNASKYLLSSTPEILSEYKSIQDLFHHNFADEPTFSVFSSVYFTYENLSLFTEFAFHPTPIKFLHTGIQTSMIRLNLSDHSFVILEDLGRLSTSSSELKAFKKDLSLPSMKSIDSDVPTIDFHHLTYSPSDHRGLRKSFRRNSSMGSVQSFESENKWEVESTGKASTNYGEMASRSSFNSHQSVTAIFQALKSTPAHIILGNDTSVEDLTSSNGPVSKVEPSESIPKKPKDQIKTSENIFPKEWALLEDEEDNSFPPFFNHMQQDYPLVHSNFLNHLAYSGNMPLSHALILLHQYLVLRSGFSQWLQQDPNSLQEDLDVQCELSQEEIMESSKFNINETGSKLSPFFCVESYYYLLKKHLSLYLANPFRIPQVSWMPNYSKLKFRNSKSIELLLTSMILNGNSKIKSYVLQTFLKLLKANPVNNFLMNQSKYLLISIVKLLPFLSYADKEPMFEIVNQILTYSSSNKNLKLILNEVKLELENQKAHSYVSPQPLAFQLLQTLERAISIHHPNQSFHFPLQHCFQSILSFPAISSFPKPIGSPSNERKITLFGWFKLGSMGSNPITSFAQLFLQPIQSPTNTTKTSSGNSQSNSIDISNFINIFFRSLYHNSESNLASLSEPSTPSTSYSNANSFHHQTTANVSNSLKKECQLCINFDLNFQQKLLKLSKEISRQPDRPGELTRQRSDSSKEKTKETTTLSSTWSSAIHSILEIEDLEMNSFEQENSQYTQYNNNLSKVLQNVSKLSQSLASFILPDCIVDYAFSEVDSWHLLELSISESNIYCTIDGVSQDILYFTPLGYLDKRHLFSKKDVLAYQSYPQFDGIKDLFDQISKDNPLKVQIGGLTVEQPSFYHLKTFCESQIVSNIVSPSSIDQSAQLPSYSMDQNKFPLIIRRLLAAFESTISGYSGDISDFFVSDYNLPRDWIDQCMNSGPLKQSYLKLPKPLTSIIISDFLQNLENPPSNQSISANRKSSMTSLLSSSSIQETIAPLERSNSFSHLADNNSKRLSNRGTCEIILYSHNSLEPKSYEYDLTPIKSDSSITIPSFLQIHNQESFINSLLSIGGFKSFYPFLEKKLDIFLKVLNIFSELLNNDEDYSLVLKAEGIDKILLHCIHKDLLLQSSSKLYQILFEWAVIRYRIDPQTQSSHHQEINSKISNIPLSLSISNPTLQTHKIIDKIHRWEILQMMLDSLIVSSVRDTNVAMVVIDRIKNMCYDENENIQKLLNKLSFTPFYFLITIWTMDGLAQFQNTLPATASKSSTGSIPEKTDSALDRRKTLTFNSNSLKEETPQLLKPHYTTAIVNSNNNNPSSSNTSNSAFSFINYYQLQVSCLKLFRVLIHGPSIESNILDENHFSQYPLLNSPMLTLPQLLNLFSFALNCSIPSEESFKRELSLNSDEESQNVVHKKDQIRRSKRIKTSIKSLYSSLPILKNIEIFESTYWQLSAGLLILNELIRVLEEPKNLLLVQSLKSPSSGFSFVNYFLRIMGSSVIEIKEIGIRMLMIYFMNSEGKLDPKQILSFDRMHGFQVMIEQLCQHEDCCDDIILDRLFALMFWQRNTRGIYLRPPPTENKPPTSIPINPQAMESNSVNATGILSVFTWNSSSQQATPNPSLGTSGSQVSSSSIGAQFSESSSFKRREIIIPQIIEVFCRLLYFSKSQEQFSRCFNSLDDCIGGESLFKPIPSSTDHFVPVEDELLVLKNLETITSQKDWLVIFCELVNATRRKVDNRNNDETGEDIDHGLGSSGLSISETESLGGISAPDIKSEDTKSQTNDTMSEDIPHEFVWKNSGEDGNNSYKSNGNRRELWTAPIEAFANHVIVWDMIFKAPSAYRAYQEVFRLSVPELSSIQEKIITQLIQSIYQITFITTNTFKEFSSNYLKNMLSFLEQLIDRNGMSIRSCVSILQSLHILNYRSTMELRQLIQDFNLIEIRKLYLTRCLVEVGQDLSIRISSLTDLSSSLLSYFTMNDFNKLLSDSQILTLILGTFGEVLDEYDNFVNEQVLTHATDICLFYESVGNYIHMPFVQTQMDRMNCLMTILQNCVNASSECKRFMQRFTDNLHYDPQGILTKLLHANQRKSTSNHSNNSNFGSDSGSETMTNSNKIQSQESSQLTHRTPPPAINSTPQSQITQSQPSVVSSSYWWPSWTTTTNTPSVNSSANGSNTIKDADIEPDIEKHANILAPNQKGSSSTSENDELKDINSFLIWFCALERKDLRAEFKSRISKEVKLVLRLAEKLRERYSQRLVKYTKTLQEKRNREKALSTKSVNDTLMGVVSSGDKISSQFSKEIVKYTRELKDRISLGHDLFNGVSENKASSIVQLRSPLRDSKTNKELGTLPQPYTEVEETFTPPAILIDYFRSKRNIDEVNESLWTSRSQQNPGLSDSEAFDSLLTCFMYGGSKI